MGILKAVHPDEMTADTIFTSVVLGFCAVHAELKHKFAFEATPWLEGDQVVGDKDAENAKGYQKFLDMLSALSELLEAGGVPIGRSLEDGIAPILDDRFERDVMICGWPGGEALRPHNRVFARDDRVGTPRSPAQHATVINSIGARFKAETSSEGYTYYGAYTGAVMEHGKKAVFSSTTQVIPASPLTHRWTEPPNRGVIQGEAHNQARPKGFGAAPEGKVIAYVHGMSYAMRDALATSPSAVATEIASGSVTTKLSSCFGCTTYMWANGFPPSATHLGQANSWHPLFLSKENDAKKQAIVQSMNTRFHLQVHGYIMRGAEILASVGGIRQGSYFHVTPTRATIARDLLREQGQRTNVAHEIGANFFLDCLTFHKSDQQRLLDTVSTYYDGASAAKKFG